MATTDITTLTPAQVGALTPAVRKVLETAQHEGNRVNWRSDADTWHQAERWEYPREIGRALFEDCDGIALYKAKLLIDQGMSPDDVLMTICKDPSGSGHAVLCVTTDKGDLILDCNHVNIATSNQMKAEGYKFLYRQHPGLGVDKPWDVLE